jgi:hypothetical protein
LGLDNPGYRYIRAKKNNRWTGGRLSWLGNDLFGDLAHVFFVLVVVLG